MKRLLLTCGALTLLTTLCAGSVMAWQYARPQPAPASETLYEGITYTRDVRTSPRDLVIHLLRIDLRAEGLRFLVTPASGDTLPARTTSDFLNDFNLQLAVNGDAFAPWHTNSPLDYYPHPGDPVDVIGYAASEGTAYSTAHPDTPTLYLSPTNKASFTRTGRVHNALSGTEMLVRNGQNTASDDAAPAPRTAIGLTRSGREMLILVVDGRQPGYSEGLTLPELADLLISLGAHDAMNLDGGGSSTLVREGALGAALLNNPIDRNIPGWERAVANHLGIYAREK
jgi:hypothetical protein